MEKRKDKVSNLCVCGHFERDHGVSGTLKPCTFTACDCRHYVEEGASVVARELITEAREVSPAPEAAIADAVRPPHLVPRPPRIAAAVKDRAAMKAVKAVKLKGAPEELRQALLDQLKRILEKPIGPKMLKELAKTALLSQRLLITAGDPSALPNRRRGMGYGGLGGLLVEDDIDPEFDGPMPIAPPAETFGASAIRELIAAAKEKNKPGVVELTKALGIAKKEGLDEVAADLQRQLLEKPVQREGWDIEPERVLRPEGAPIEQLAQDVTDILDGDPEGGVA